MSQRIQQMIALLAAAALLLAVWIAWQPEDGLPTRPALPTAAPTPTLPSAWRGTIYALLADGRLVAVRIEDGVLLAERTLSATRGADRSRYPGHLLARSKDQKWLYALVPGEPGQTNVLAVLDRSTNTVRTTINLGQYDAIFKSLAVGPQSGMLYLFGRQRDGRLFGDLVIVKIDPFERAELNVWMQPELPRDADTRIYQAAIADDEHRLYVSFIGGRNGVDWFDIDNLGGIKPCLPWQQRQFRRCVEAEGGFALYGDGLLAATGGSGITAWGPGDELRSGLDTQLYDNPLNDFALDSAANRLYVVGSCEFFGGYSAIDVRAEAMLPPTEDKAEPTAMPARALLPAHPANANDPSVPCGQRLTLGPGSLLVVGKTAKFQPEARRQGALLLMDRDTGLVLRTIPTPSEPVDVIVVP